MHFKTLVSVANLVNVRKMRSQLKSDLRLYIATFRGFEDGNSVADCKQVAARKKNY
jgi:hypothetical protein